MTGKSHAGAPASGHAATVAEAKALLLQCQQAVTLHELLPRLETFFSLLKRASATKNLRFSFSRAPTRTAPGEAPDKFTTWLLRAFDQFQAILADLFESRDREDEVQSVALRFFMRLLMHQHSLELASRRSIRPEEKSAFPLAAYQLLIAHLLRASRFSDFLRNTLLTDYLCKFADLRYYFLVVLRKILSEQRRAPSPKGGLDAAEGETPAVDSATERDEGENPGEAASDEPSVCTDTSPGDAEKWYVWKAENLPELARRLFPLLIGLPAPEGRAPRKARSGSTAREDASSSDIDLPDDTGSDDELGVSVPRGRASAGSCFLASIKTTKCADPALYRSLLQEVWLLYLRNLPRDLEMTQKLLHSVPKALLPHMSNPLLLSDFFLDAFHASDKTISVAVLALSGLFFLLAKHRLGDPDALVASAETNGGESAAQEEPEPSNSRKVCFHFYQRLFQLVTPAAFSVCKNGRFLRLLNAALRSSLLPNSLVAAFIKKCSRVACLVPPATALYLVALVYALLKKYGSVCVSLVDVHPSLAAQLVVEGDRFDLAHLSLHAPPAESVSGDAADAEERRQFGDAGADPRQPRDALAGVLRRCLPTHLAVEKSGVLACVKQQAQMSLWELDLLKSHFFHAVRQLSCMLDSDVTKPGGKDVDIDDYLGFNFDALLSRELKTAARAKAVAVVFKKEERVAEDVENLASVTVECFRKRRKL
ncbi:hypothetical protein NCLIV_010500 [Neospora caninum Liverpool]|uniref:CBF/Mak21 family protein n=1 Tax=Neospora caninum (strain Liverpool) TaxID=572307 RepID=F0VA92_NEOCL|nr:hypothetical protein NCLIV_010500 [Neospora caninum Liverpool]CBZ50581.1 hypothetical protein NCLIV_010500 [Neospora caninum Liverpool]CEL65194.1 TPA: CBF/Mak21 family protein [Neospora caninum Liverpool]|eukprot:XP_003880614.1 hypothetical protein NCLIV_010500 [Neospora caninum Liverpool]